MVKRKSGPPTDETPLADDRPTFEIETLVDMTEEELGRVMVDLGSAVLELESRASEAAEKAAAYRAEIKEMKAKMLDLAGQSQAKKKKVMVQAREVFDLKNAVVHTVNAKNPKEQLKPPRPMSLDEKQEEEERIAARRQGKLFEHPTAKRGKKGEPDETENEGPDNDYV